MQLLMFCSIDCNLETCNYRGYCGILGTCICETGYNATTNCSTCEFGAENCTGKLN